MCEHCGQSFVYNAELQIHLRTHTGEKPFVCKICDKGFVARMLLNSHMKTSHKSDTSKGYKCQYCENDFLYPSLMNLNWHLHQVHRDQLPLKCKICNKGFKLQSKLFFHINRYHKNQAKELINEMEPGKSIISKVSVDV